MRKLWRIGVVVLSIALAAPAFAQLGGDTEKAKTILTGVNPGAIREVKINPSKAMRANNLTKAFQPNATQRSTKVPGLNASFPRLTLGSWPPKLPQFMSKAPAAQTPPTTFPRGVSALNPPKK